MGQPLAIVIGAGRVDGIGYACAEQLVQDGYNVVCTFYSDEKLADEVVQGLTADRAGAAVAVRVDVTESEEVIKAALLQCEWLKSATCSSYVSVSGESVSTGPVDVLVLNQAMYVRQQTVQLPAAAAERTLQTNFFGCLRVWTVIAPYLTVDARIVTVGSQLGVRGSAHGGDYAASKGALHAWTRSLALSFPTQAAPHVPPSHVSDEAKAIETSGDGSPGRAAAAGVGPTEGPKMRRANCVAPGTIQTSLLAKYSLRALQDRAAAVPLGRLGAPKDIGQVVGFLASDASSYMTGSVVHVNGGGYMP